MFNQSYKGKQTSICVSWKRYGWSTWSSGNTHTLTKPTGFGVVSRELLPEIHSLVTSLTWSMCCNYHSDLCCPRDPLVSIKSSMGICLSTSFSGSYYFGWNCVLLLGVLKTSWTLQAIIIRRFGTEETRGTDNWVRNYYNSIFSTRQTFFLAIKWKAALKRELNWSCSKLFHIWNSVVQNYFISIKLWSYKAHSF